MTPCTDLVENTPLPAGFAFAGTHCGIKRTRPDLALLGCAEGTVAAGVFTQSPVRAPCVARNAALVPHGSVRAVLVNSGNANAMTGPDGERANTHMAEHAAAALGCAPEQVLTLSTGVIGVPLNTGVIGKATPRLAAEAGDDVAAFAEAILTTDTCTKVAHLELTLPGASAPVRILGVAKGSGMIHPDMATTLGFVCTDAAVSPQALQDMLAAHIDTTFNAITVDGDTSTNDTVLALASGKSGVFVEGEARAVFERALHAVLRELAKQVAADGEGATRLLQVQVHGASSAAAAHALARGICRSSLFKCSVFAGKAEWGRLVAAAGQAALEADVSLAPSDLHISVQGVPVVRSGAPIEAASPSELTRKLREPEIAWDVRVGDGPHAFTAWGCDLSYDYVRINADEASQVEVQPGGMVARNLTLAAYSPRLKHQLLVDGLTYVRRFVGLRAMVYVHSGPADRFDLMASLAQDLSLCLDAGMRLLVVVPSEALATKLRDAVRVSGNYAAIVPPDPQEISLLLDRGHLCVAVEGTPEPGEQVDLAIKLGLQKLLALGDDQGLRDDTGLVSTLSPELLLQGLARGRFVSQDPEFPALARQAAVRGVPALHLVDGRIPHALVGELFTDQGIGTLITRQTV